MGIKETSDLWDAYCKGWNAALRNAAISFWGVERDAILAHLKEEPPELQDRHIGPQEINGA